MLLGRDAALVRRLTLMDQRQATAILVILIVAALVVLRDREWLDGRSFAVAAVVQVLVMQVAQVIGYTRGRQVVDADLPAPASGGEGP